MKIVQAFLIWSICALHVWAVKDYLFKSCDNSGFCKRNRHYAHQIAQGFGAPYFVSPESVNVGEKSIIGTIFKKLPLNSLVALPFELSLLKGESIRFKVDEDRQVTKGKLTTRRYNEASHAAFDEKEEEKYQVLAAEKIAKTASDVLITFGLEDRYRAVLEFSPIKLTLYRRGVAQVIVNSDNFFNIEHFREKDDNVNHLWENLELDFDMFTDSFGDSKHDTLPMGPESVAVDVAFNGYTHVYGIPEHADSFSLKSTVGTTWPYRLFNVDIFEYETESRMPMYGTIPLMVAVKPDVAVGVFWLNAADTFVDIDKAESVKTHWISENGVLDVVLLIGETPGEINKKYGQLTGNVGLPQEFALGYHQCRWNYNDEDDVLGVNANMDIHRIPYDTIWLDIEYADKKKYFTWNEDTFGHRMEMLDTLDHTGRNLVVIIDPHLKTEYAVSDFVTKNRLTINDPNNQTYKGHCWPGESVWIDSLNPRAQDYWDLLFEYSTTNKFIGEKTNVHLWNDMNEPSFFNGPETSSERNNLHYGDWEHRSVHNMWGKTFHELTYRSLTKRLEQTPRQRPFILTRSYYAGSQRTAAMWTGDNMAKWEYLKISIPMILTSNVVGMPFAGADVGGFFGDPSKELLTRWYQTGIWYPFFRAHAHIDSRRREPWVAGEPYTSIMRDAVRLRYALLPTLYTLFYESSVSGAPIWKPMVYENPENSQTYAIDDQFFLGNSGLLIKPVTEENASVVDIYIPDDENYYDFTNGQAALGIPLKISQPGTYTKEVTLSDIPILLKGGSSVFIRPRYRRSSRLMRNDPYQVVIALDKNGQAVGQLYVDDGESFDYKKGKFISVTLAANTNSIEGVSFSGDEEYAKISPLYIEKITILGLEQAIESVEVTQAGRAEHVRFIKKDDKVELLNTHISLSGQWKVAIKSMQKHDEL